MAKPLVLAAFEPQEPQEALAIEEELGSRAEIRWAHELNPALRAEILPRVEVLLLFSWPDDLTADLPRMKQLRFVQRFPAGLEGLPFHQLARLRPRPAVAGGSGSNAVAVAEHAWALILACAKHLGLHDRQMRQGEFHQADAAPHELAGRTLGLLGYGAIGQRVARIARAFGMKVLAVRKNPGARPRAPVIGSLRQIDRLLRESDVLVVALPLTRETEGLLGAREFSRMKTDAILVNVARGKILDEAAAFHHLATHPNATWGFDVWWHYAKGLQPMKQAFPFASLPNVLMTPHMAALVPGYRAAMARFGAQNALRHLRGQKPLNVVEFRDYLTREGPP